MQFYNFSSTLNNSFMSTNPLPVTPTDSSSEYDPQLDAEDAALSSGNTRLGLIVGALFVAGLLSYALIPKQSGGGALAAVTPSFMLEGASVTGARQVAAVAPATAPAAAALDKADAPVRPKSTSVAVVSVAAAPVAHPAAAVASAATLAAPAPAATPAVPVETVAPTQVVEPVRASSVTMTGRILDENGKPLAGATVLLKGSGKGTGTDANGNFTLEAPAGDNTLQFGYGGYQDEELRVRNGQPLNVTLTPTPGSKRRRK